jgi:hypothetical protein
MIVPATLGIEGGKGLSPDAAGRAIDEYLAFFGAATEGYRSAASALAPL